LKEGFYSSRITLRKHDELKDLASELNELAEIMQQYKIDETKDS
jgi:signal transduction histidine kinase